MAAALLSSQHLLDSVMWTKFIGMALFDLIAHSSPPPYTYAPTAQRAPSSCGGSGGSGPDQPPAAPLTGLSLAALFDAVMFDVTGRRPPGDGTNYVVRDKRQCLKECVCAARVA